MASFWIVRQPDLRRKRVYIFTLVPQGELTKPPRYFILTARDLGAIHQDDPRCKLDDIGAQTRRVLENMRRILYTGGASLRNFEKTTVFVTDIRYREDYGEVR